MFLGFGNSSAILSFKCAGGIEDKKIGLQWYLPLKTSSPSPSSAFENGIALKPVLLFTALKHVFNK